MQNKRNIQDNQKAPNAQEQQAVNQQLNDNLANIPLEALQGLTNEEIQQLQQLEIQQQQQELGQFNQMDAQMYMQLQNELGLDDYQLNQQQLNEIQQLNQLQMLKELEPNLIQQSQLELLQQLQLQQQELLQPESNIQDKEAKLINLQSQINAIEQTLQQQQNPEMQDENGQVQISQQEVDNCFDPNKLSQIVNNLGYNLSQDDLQRLDPLTIKQLIHLQDIEKQKDQNDIMQLQFALMQQYPDLTPEQIQQVIQQDDQEYQQLMNCQENQEQDLQNQLQLLNSQNQDQVPLLALQQQIEAQQQLMNAEKLEQQKQTLQVGDQEGTHGHQSSNSTERQKAFEKQKDQMFEDKLWIFYQNLRERLSQGQIDKITKKQNQFFEQMEKISSDYFKNKKASGDKESDEVNSKSNDDNIENCNDSTFQELIYGPNSTLDPDNFIKVVQQTISEHRDLAKEFRRFLPDDIEEDELSVEQKYNQFVSNMQLDHDGEILDNQAIGDQENLIEKLKAVAQMRLLELLREYSDKKLNGSPQEALRLYTDQIMSIVENYHQYLSSNSAVQFNYNQNLVDSQENMNVTQYTIDQHEYQMNILLELIPQEIIDNYKIQNPEIPNGKDSKPNQKNTTKSNTKKSEKKLGRPKRSNVKAIEEDSFVSSSKLESSDDDSKLHKVDDASQSQNSQTEQEVTSNDQDEQRESENEEIEESQEHENEPMEDESQQESQSMDQTKKKGDETETLSENIHVSEKKLSKKQIMSIYDSPNFKNVNKYELKVFQTLHQSMKTDAEWTEFIKLFQTYLDGIISIDQFFLLFDHRFAYRLSESMKDELKILLPTRDTSRRCQSNILKPWNDLENQKFEKIPDSSYYKIDKYFQLPICSAKMDTKNGMFYRQFLNENYLSLSLGSENFKFKVRNLNEDLIFRNEDNMYKLDTQIEMYEKCQAIVENEKKLYDSKILTDPTFAQRYAFPKHKFSPMIYYWEEKSQQTLLTIMEAQPFQRDCLNILSNGLVHKLQDLQNQKLDQMSNFEDVYRKNFKKSLDHRSFQYKEFIKKFQQKHYHMTCIKQYAQRKNQFQQILPQNILKGGNYEESLYNHTFGQFIQQDFKLFDGGEKIKDYPIDMDYKFDLSEHQHKLPHSRMIFQDQEAKSISIKILMLQIKYSSNHQNSESRQKLIDILRELLENYMKIENIKDLLDQCADNQIESLTLPQIDIILNQNIHLYYKKRCEQTLKDQENHESKQDVQISSSIDDKNVDNVSPIKIQIQDITRKVVKLEDSNQKEKSVTQSVKDDQSPEIKEESEAEVINKQSSPMIKSNLMFNDMKLMDESSSGQKPQNSLFLPHFPQDKKQDEEYSLMFAPSNIFMFFSLFYSIYERIVKAKDLVREKIIYDLAEMSVQEQSSINELNLNDMFQKERFEHLLKAIYATTTQQSFSGSQIAASLSLSAGYSHNHHLMDHNRYEDFARQLLGQNAFLIFQIDKIVSMAIKQLQQMHSDSVYKDSMKLYKQMSNTEIKNDSMYLSNYVSQIIFEQFSLKQLQVQPQPLKEEINGCIHSVSKFDNSDGICNEKNGGNGGKSEGQGGQAANTALSASAAASQQSNFQVFRLLWSKESNILSIHYFNLNPLQIQTSGPKNFKKIMSENYDIIKNHTTEPLAPTNFEDDSSPNCNGCSSRFNKLDKEGIVSPPIFLKRNLKPMTRKRDAKAFSKKNGLTHRILPAMGNIVFDCQTEDALNNNGITKISVQNKFKFELERSNRANKIRNDRLNEIMEQNKPNSKK